MDDHKALYEEFAKKWAHAEDYARTLLEKRGVTKEEHESFAEWVICANADLCVGKNLKEARCYTCRVGRERDAFRDALAVCGGRLDPEEGAEPIPSQAEVRIRYTNHRGETSVRTIIPARVVFEANAWHPKRQWLLHAWDVEKAAARSFALAGVLEWGVA